MDEHAPFSPPHLDDVMRMVEAVLFAAQEPLTAAQIGERLPRGADVAEALARLTQAYEGRGVRLMKVNHAYIFRTAPDLAHLLYHERVEHRKLSRAALETLAIIAYHQPVTRAEIEEIRGVSLSRGTIDQLMELGWIRFGKRKMTPGRPVTFMATDAFLLHFGLESTRDLPGLKELREAGLLDNRLDSPAQGALGFAPLKEDEAPEEEDLSEGEMDEELF